MNSSEGRLNTVVMHVIDAIGLHKFKEKVEAVLEAPIPKNEAQLR